jgi:hypothetical protein
VSGLARLDRRPIGWAMAAPAAQLQPPILKKNLSLPERVVLG